jgi:hypothetical protein
MLIPNLIFLYHVMVASEPLLCAAIERTTDAQLKAYFENHLEEERDHAQWLAEDLASADIDVGKTQPPLVAVQMAGSLYYLIFHVHPAALLGYMEVLESWPMDKERFKARAQGYPPELLRTLNHHIDHDPAHLEDLRAIIDSVPEHAGLIRDVGLMTRRYLQEAALQIHAATPLYLISGDDHGRRRTNR